MSWYQDNVKPVPPAAPAGDRPPQPRQQPKPQPKKVKPVGRAKEPGKGDLIDVTA